MDIELDIRQILTILWRRLWVLFLSTLICAAIAFSVSFWLITPLYSASASMYVYNQQNRTSTNVTSTDLATSQKLVSTYLVILKSNSVMGQVSQRLGGRYTTLELQKMLNASAIDNTEAFKIIITNKDPAAAQEIANTIVTVAPAEIIRVVKAGSVEVIDYATKPDKPSSPDVIRNTLIGALLGLILAAFLVILRAITDTTIRSEEDLTEVFEIPILGVIPKLNGEGKGEKQYAKEK